MIYKANPFIILLAAWLTLPVFALAQKRKKEVLPLSAVSVPACHTIDSLYAWSRQDFLAIRSDAFKKWNGNNSILYHSRFQLQFATSSHVFYSYGKSTFEATFGGFKDDKSALNQIEKVVTMFRSCNKSYSFAKQKSNHDQPYKIYVQVRGMDVYVGAINILSGDSSKVVSLWMATGR